MSEATQNPKPMPADVQVGGISPEMKARAQWCLWKFEPDADGKWRKTPYRVRRPGETYDRKASSADPTTWSTFAEAIAAYEAGGWAGLMYAFSGEPGDYVGIDLDKCRDPETGEIKPWSAEQRNNARWKTDAPEPLDIIAKLATYAEVSPSETGVKLWVQTNDFPISGSKAGDFEAYQKGRFFCVTGLRLPTCPASIAEHNGEVWDICGKFLGQAPADDGDDTDDDEQDDEAADKPTAEEDAAIIEAALENDAEGKLKRLWKGDWQSFNGLYPSQSEADQALCNLLAYLLDGKHWRIDRQFRRSKLMRGKWDERRGSRTYGCNTVRRAVRSHKKRKQGREGETRPAAVIRNFQLVPKGDDSEKFVPVPLSMGEIIAQVQNIVGGSIRRVDSGLFVHDTIAKPDECAVDWLPKPASLFGFLQSRAAVDWKGGEGFVGREEFHAELCRTAQAHVAVEVLPHEPLMAGHYYCCGNIASGRGDRLQFLLDRFCPETPLDRDLIQAAIMTLFWGGLGGARPVFVVTSRAGRGAGKSKTVSMLALVAGGAVDFGPKDEFREIKTRLLSPDAMTKRAATLDNVKTLRFSWAELEGLITSPFISGRQLFVGNGTRPNTLTWFVTLNGASLSTDMAQRAVVIHINKPQRTAAWEEETTQFIIQHRAEIVADILAELRRERFQLARFTRWASWEKDVLSRLPDPTQAQAIIAERQEAVDVEEEEAGVIEDFFAEQLSRLKYDPDRDQVHIPVDVATRWFNWATGETHKVTSVSRHLGQMSDEGKVKRIGRNASRTNGRGFLWTGEYADVAANVNYDLSQRLSAVATEKANRVSG